jgi:probable selenium-dependent hydroxylase accessory protein YqeC
MRLEKSDFFRSSDLSSGTWRTACIAAAIDGPVSTAPVSGSYMPVIQTKRTGFTGEQICALHVQLKTENSELRTLVEADGARGLRIKAPGQGEPVIPPCADAVCALASLEAIGRPLDDRIAHRLDRVASLTRTMPGSIITASLIVDLLAHADGGLKGIPAGARKVAVLTQQGETVAHPDANGMLAELIARGYDRAVLLAPRAAQPVLAVK